MTSGAPWSVKGIDPKAREVAKDLARRSGMTLGEWLNRMILEEEGPEEITSQSYFTDPDYAPRIFGERADRTYYETPRHEIFRAPEPPIRPEALSEPPSRYEAPSHPGDEIGRVTDALDRLTERIETSEGRTGAAISGVEQSVREAIARIEAAERDHVSIAARFEGVSEEVRADQQRLAERVRRMEAEASGPRSAEALRALEQALGRVANHLYEGENRTRQTLADLRQRVERAEAGQPAPSVEVIEDVVGRVGERLTEAEARTSEALDSLRASFAGLDHRLGSVEAAQPGQDLEQRFQQLSDHLKARFESTRGELVQALEASAESRFDRMERKLTEMAEQVREAEQRSAQAIERVGQEMLTVADNLNRRVASSETRSADAIGQVSGEIARIANTVETRLSRNDTIQAEAMEKLGGEIARISERLAERIANAERRSAQAFDEVGEQVARVTDKINQRSDNASDALVERIRQSEERTARLLEEAREKIDQRLSETQRRISEQMAAAPAHPALADRAQAFGEPEPFPELPEPAAAPPTPPRAFTMGAPGAMTRSGFATPPPRPTAPAAAPPTFEQLAPAAFQAPEDEEDPFGAPAEFEAAEPHAPTAAAFEAPEPKAEAYQVEAPAHAVSEETAPRAAAEAFDTPRAFAAESFPAAPDQRGFDAEDFEAADGFAASAQEEAEDEPFEPELELAEPHEPAQPTFRSAIAEEPVGGASAFDAAFDAEPEPAAHELHDEADHHEAHHEDRAEDEAPFAAFAEPESEPGAPLSTREVIEQARAAARASVQGDGRGRRARKEKAEAKSGGSLFGGLFAKRAKSKSGGSLQTALFVTGAAAFVGMGAAGFVMMNGQAGGAPPKRVAEALAALTGSKQEIKGHEADTTPFPSSPRVAMALNPQPLAPTAPGATLNAPDLSDRFAKAAADVDQKKAGAVDELKAVAQLGYAPAQFYLARLYEKGEGGLRPDPVQARQWTERAAEAGDRRAMHNLGMAYIYGTGGPKNSTTAAQWFRRAAELGLVDSQFNLAALYEKGLGVSQNPAEAYKWYLIAAKTGDGDARKRADQVKAGLTPDARVVAEQAANAFRVAAVNPSAAPAASADIGANAGGVMVAQRALSRLGYYLGPTDGTASPALKLAVAAYQRDHNTPATGVLDQATLQDLSVYTR